MATKPTSKSKKVVVKKGDTANKIANRYGFKNYKAAGIKGLGSNPDLIRPGQVLEIGGGLDTPTASKGGVNIPSADTGYYSRAAAAGAGTSQVETDLEGATPGTETAPVTEGQPSKEYYSRISDREKALQDIVTDPGEAPSYDKIRRRLMGSNQALIDAISSEYARTIGEERAAGDVRNARTRALSVSANLAGSDFATAAAEGTEGENRKVIQSYERERDSKIGAILAGVAEKASTQYESERQNYRNNAESALKYTKEFRDSALEDAGNLSAMGVTADSLKKESPDTWNQLLKQTGYTDIGLTAYFASQKPEGEKVFSEKVGNTYVIGYRDKITGKISTEKVPIAEGFTDFQNIGGKPYFVNYDTGEIRLATGYQGGSSSSSSSKSLFADTQTEKYYNTLPKEFRDSWSYNYGVWGNPAYKTTYDDLQKDYKEWSKNNPYKGAGGGIGDL